MQFEKTLEAWVVDRRGAVHDGVVVVENQAFVFHRRPFAMVKAFDAAGAERRPAKTGRRSHPPGATL
jgi:hypothetical protein